MIITDIKIFPVREDKLKAFVSIILDDCFMVNDIKVIRGKESYFISMPSRRKRNGKFKDIAHPLNNETRQVMEQEILAAYQGFADAAAQEVVEGASPTSGTGPASLSSPGAEGSRPEGRPRRRRRRSRRGSKRAAADQSGESQPSESRGAEPQRDQRDQREPGTPRERRPQPAEPARSAAPKPPTKPPTKPETEPEAQSAEEVAEKHLSDSFWGT